MEIEKQYKILKTNSTDMDVNLNKAVEAGWKPINSPTCCLTNHGLMIFQLMEK